MKKTISLILVMIFMFEFLPVAAEHDTVYATRMDALKLFAEVNETDISGADQNVLTGFSDISGLSKDDRNTLALFVSENIIKGYPDGTLRPDGEITRGEYAAIIERLKDTAPQRKRIFEFDLDYEDSEPWCYDALKFCSSNLIMIGYGKKFGINDKLTKEQLKIIENRFYGNFRIEEPSDSDVVCAAFVMQNCAGLDYEVVIQSSHDERLRLSDDEIPDLSEASKSWGMELLKVYNKRDGTGRTSNIKYRCALDAEYKDNFDYEKYIGNEEAVLRLSSRISYVHSQALKYTVETPVFDDANEFLSTKPYEDADSLPESDKYVPFINEKINNKVKSKAFFISSEENYLSYIEHHPGIGTEHVNKAKGYEYFKYISGAPEGLENGRWYRRVVHARTETGYTPTSWDGLGFYAEYDEPEPVPDHMLE